MLKSERGGVPQKKILAWSPSVSSQWDTEESQRERVAVQWEPGRQAFTQWLRNITSNASPNTVNLLRTRSARHNLCGVAPNMCNLSLTTGAHRTDPHWGMFYSTSGWLSSKVSMSWRTHEIMNGHTQEGLSRWGNQMQRESWIWPWTRERPSGWPSETVQ